jgi:hypothetical protein
MHISYDWDWDLDYKKRITGTVYTQHSMQTFASTLTYYNFDSVCDVRYDDSMIDEVSLCLPVVMDVHCFT